MSEQKYLVRHAKTDTLPDGERVIKHDTETQAALSATATLLKRNNVDLLVAASSPKTRAIQTTEALGAGTVSVRDFLDEVNASKFGMTYEQVVAMLQSGHLNEDYRNAGATFVEHLTSMPEQAAVTHSDILATLIDNPHIKTEIMGIGHTALNGLEVPNLSVVRVTY